MENTPFSDNVQDEPRPPEAVGSGARLGSFSFFSFVFSFDFDNHYSFDRGIDPITEHEPFSGDMCNRTAVTVRQNIVGLGKGLLAIA